MYRKKVTKESDIVSAQFQNKLAQIVALTGARRTFVNLGRGSAKTTDILVEKVIDLVYEMPGAPVVWLASTFTDLVSNILPGVLEGLERKGFIEGVHYVVEKEPPTYNEREKKNLPDWLKKHFWKPFNKLATYKRTVIFFSGLNIRFGSLDRPSSLAGGSFVFVFGDEAKYFPPQKVANLLKANRGYYAEYGRCINYRGVMFTSDLPDTSHIGEYDWMENEVRNMDIPSIVQVMKAGLVYNESLHEFVAAKEKWMKTHAPEDKLAAVGKLKTANRWKARWELCRRQTKASTFYIRASSYVNVDILTPDWFADALASGLPDVRTAILSLKAQVQAGDRFYTALSERHFYFDGFDESVEDSLSMRTQEDCRVLKYLNRALPLRLGVDFGNMCSMSIGQLTKHPGDRDTFRIVKFLYTLAPEYLEELGKKFRDYFAPMENRVIYLYYDRAGNSYKNVGKDQVSALKRAIEYDEAGKRTGWVVHLMSQKQGDLRQSEEYHFMQILMKEENPSLPRLLIDAYAAKNLKLSLEGAKTKVKDGIVYKNKSSEKLPIPDLPTKSTNPSDSFKYLMMTPEYRKMVKSGKVLVQGNLGVITNR